MFINFWYVAEESKNVTDTPVYVKMLGQDFVIFRDSQGKARCLSNICVHRGASLADGITAGDCVQCPYHGWQFDGTGACTRIPSLGPDAQIPSRAKVDSYPVEERYGLIFAFLGDLPEEERPPIMEIPEFGKDGYAVTYQRFEWDFDYKRSIENGLDAAHNEFVHTTHIATGSDENYIVPDLNLVETEYGSGFFNDPPGPPLANKKMREASGREEDAKVRVGTGHHGCNCLWTFIYPVPGMEILQYLYETPIDEGRTRLILVNMRNFMLEEEHDEAVKERNEFVALQDRDVLLKVRPVLTPETRTKEVFVTADKPIDRYRRFVKEWEANGWRIDVDEVNRTQNRTAYAIPSPGRRTEKNWVIDAVPMIDSSSAQAQAAAE